jgi:hypothetical protein
MSWSQSDGKRLRSSKIADQGGNIMDNKLTVILAGIFISVFSIVTISEAQTVKSGKEQADSMKIRLKVGDTVLTASLIDSATTRDFISLLPLTLTLEDYAGTEKISNLPKRLSTENAPSGSDPSVGDIAYYTPWGNLAIFYRDFGYSRGLVILGKIDSGMDAFKVPDSVRVTIEVIK